MPFTLKLTKIYLKSNRNETKTVCVQGLILSENKNKRFSIEKVQKKVSCSNYADRIAMANEKIQLFYS